MAAPQRIVSLLSSATEILYGIGLGDRVVAVSHECDFPQEVCEKPRITFANVDSSATSNTIDSAVRQRVEAAEPLYGIDTELLERLRPDLIVTQAQCDVCAVKLGDVTAAVQRSDTIKNVPILALNPTSLSDVFDDIVRIGDACACVAPAQRYVQHLRARVDQLSEGFAARADDRPLRTALIEWIEPVMLAANWMPELLEIAGGNCPLAVAGHHSGYADWQQIVSWDPEAIVVCPCGFDLKRTISEAHVLGGFDGWKSLTAVRNERVYAVDGNAYFNRSGPRLVESVEILAHLLHPKHVPPPLPEANREAAWCALQISHKP